MKDEITKISLTIILLIITFISGYSLNDLLNQDNKATNRNISSQEVLINEKDLSFITYTNYPDKTPHENRIISMLTQEDSNYLFDKEGKLYNYNLSINPLKYRERAYDIRIKYFDHGGFSTRYALFYDPIEDKILFNTEDLLIENRLGSVRLLSTDEVEVCYSLPMPAPSTDRKCETIGIPLK